MFGAVQKDIQNAGRYKMEQRSTKPMHYPVCSIRKTWIQSDIFARILQGISLGHLTKFFPQYSVDLATGAVIHPHGVWSVEKITSYCSYTLLTFIKDYTCKRLCAKRRSPKYSPLCQQVLNPLSNSHRIWCFWSILCLFPSWFRWYHSRCRPILGRVPSRKLWLKAWRLEKDCWK